VPSLAWVVALSDSGLVAEVTGLRRELHAAGLTDAGPPGADACAATVVWADRPLGECTVETLLAPGRRLILAGPTLEAADPDGLLAAAAGVDVGRRSPVHDVRVRPGRDAGPLAQQVPDHSHAGAAHLGPHTHVRDGVLPMDKTADDVQVLLTARLGLNEQPLATWRPDRGVLAWTLGSVPGSVTAAASRRLFLLTVRRAIGLADPAPVRVGLLGYGAIGHEHSRAVRAVPGLELAAVCDTSGDRIEAARRHAPQVRTHTDAEALIADDGVDLVVVSTPPDTHGRWALAALDAGRHVVMEKPFAIRTCEADEVLGQARDRSLVAMVYQNRRFDPDFLALRAAVRAGRLGRLFHLEAFVGGHGHPCNLWHSDAQVSGGAFYDWGAHVLDQLLDLVGTEVEHVTAATHKLRWFDVTNADHSRVTVRFVDGVEATFVYSDLAAALKPRWYVLGTDGAVVGHWRAERVIGRTDIGTLSEDVLAPADSPPVLDLHTADGSVTRLATPAGPAHAFHAELADRIRFGLPTTVTGEQSRRVLAVMEAAVTSAETGGQPVVPR
jgi:predicted dehydrogenase